MNKYIVLIFLGLGIGLLAIFLILYLSVKGNINLGQAGNRVISTSPANGQTNVPGTAQFSITFAKPITNSQEFHLTMSPDFPFQKYSIISPLPSQTVTIKPVGLLLNNNTYTVSVWYGSTKIYQFAFKTIVGPPTQDDPEAVNQGEQEALKVLPLVHSMPYESTNLHAEYYAPLKIRVTIKNKSYTQDQARTEIEDWMKRKGVDPATHTLTFVYQ